MTQKIPLSPGFMPRVNRNQRIPMMILRAYLTRKFQTKMMRNFFVKINKIKLKNKESLRMASLMTSVKNLPSGKTLGILLKMQN